MKGWLLSAVAGLALGACSTQHPEQERLNREQAAATQWAQTGYRGRVAVPFSTHRLSLKTQGQLLEAELLLPARQDLTPAPLVIYLPGLGESPQAGELWRTAWARAGHAVLSVQALAEDAGAWQSELARSGEFSQLGQQRYADAAMQQRLQTLAALWRQVEANAAAGDVRWKGVNLNRVALAGFDLGAYAVQVAGGERLADGSTPALPFTPRALVVLSPFAAESALSPRYAAMGVPTLAVSGNQDFDPVGLMHRIEQRRRPFEGMPGPDQYWLSLWGGSHALLSGNPERLSERAAREAAAAARRQGGRSSGGRGQRGMEGNGHEGYHDPYAQHTEPRARAGGPNLSLLSAAIQTTSTAFLDAHLSGDPVARQWLTHTAPNWLRDQAVWERK